jgi:hypothetical protein
MKDLFFVIYKIMPFIMVAYLLITAVFAGSIGGLMTLVGLGITAIITIAVSRLDYFKSPNVSDTLLTFNETALSKLPLSTHTFAYMLGYFVFVLSKNDLVSNNALLISALTIILGGDLYYNNSINNGVNAFMATIIGIFGGVIWGAIMPNTMRMVPQSYDQSKCNVKKGIYRCRIKRTGEIVQ